MNRIIKVMEQFSYTRCQAVKTDSVRWKSGHNVLGVIVQMPDRFIVGTVRFDFNPWCPSQDNFLLCLLLSIFAQIFVTFFYLNLMVGIKIFFARDPVSKPLK